MQEKLRVVMSKKSPVTLKPPSKKSLEKSSEISSLKHLQDTQIYIKNLFSFIGEDGSREGLYKTPERVAMLHETLYGGYKIDPKTILDSVFSDGLCNEMVIVRDIEFYSMCEHHLLPFFGKISIGYIPDKKVVGISNLSRLVEVFARRLQIQEKLTTQIADTIMQYLKPKGAMVVCEALHLCMAMRGNAKQNAKILTSAVRGLFQQDSRTRMEFMQLIKSQ